MNNNQLEALHAAEERAKNLLMQLELLRKVDYIKYRLNALKQDGSYYDLINDTSNRNLVKELFDTDDKLTAIKMYKELIAHRNYLVHPFTSRAWKNKDRLKPDNFKWVNKRRLAVAKLIDANNKIKIERKATKDTS